MLICTATTAYPQASLKLSGNTGKGKVLTADFTRSDVVSVSWKVNGKVIHTSGSSAIGVTVAGGRCQGSNPDQLNNPNGIFVDKDNNIWVADASNGRVQKFADGSRNAVRMPIPGVRGWNPSSRPAMPAAYPDRIKPQ